MSNGFNVNVMSIEESYVLRGHWSEWSPCTGASLQKTRRREVLASPQGVGMGFNVSLVEAGAKRERSVQRRLASAHHLFRTQRFEHI